jgi:hypothetical protein
LGLLDKQIQAIKEIYKELEKEKTKIQPVIIGKFALSVYTQGLYPANIISFLYPDIPLLQKVLLDLGYKNEGDFWTKNEIVVEISKNFELITGKFNQIVVDDDFVINVISLEDLLIDMMNECMAGDDLVCDIIKMLVKSYKKSIDFHYIFKNLKNKMAVIKFKEYKQL